MLGDDVLRRLVAPDRSEAETAEAREHAEAALAGNPVSDAVDSFVNMVDALKAKGHTIEYVNPNALKRN